MSDVHKKFLDQQFEAAAAEIAKRGEPNCFVVMKTCPVHGLEAPPVAIYSTRAALYERFPEIGFEPGWSLAVAMWWFDDKGDW